MSTRSASQPRPSRSAGVGHQSYTISVPTPAPSPGTQYTGYVPTGSKIGAENGQLIFIVGGATEPVEYLDPLFKAMGKLVIHIGGTGKGQSAKLCMNLMLALIYEGFAEAYTLGQKMGVDPHKLIELVQASMAPRSLLHRLNLRNCTGSMRRSRPRATSLNRHFPSTSRTSRLPTSNPRRPTATSA